MDPSNLRSTTYCVASEPTWFTRHVSFTVLAYVPFDTMRLCRLVSPSICPDMMLLVNFLPSTVVSTLYILIWHDEVMSTSSQLSSPETSVSVFCTVYFFVQCWPLSVERYRSKAALPVPAG